jgi:hypothetical protein
MELELELELIQTQMTQKSMLRAEGESACVVQRVMARAKIRAWVAKSLAQSEALVGSAYSGNA